MLNKIFEASGSGKQLGTCLYVFAWNFVLLGLLVSKNQNGKATFLD